MTKISKQTSKTEQERLVSALDKQQLQTIRSYLRKGWNPHEPLSGTNPLNIVGGTKAARLLVEHGADLNASFKHLAPVAVHAAGGREEVVKYLLQSGADPNISYRGDRFKDIPKGTTWPCLDLVDRL
jgi:hypothetical protein